VVGAPYEDSNATGVNGDQIDNSALNSGAAYLFTGLGIGPRLAFSPDGRGGFVIHFSGIPDVGDGGTLLTSPDALQWTARDSGTTFALFAATYGQDLFVAVGANGTITTSRDGVGWDAKQPLRGLACDRLTSIAYGQDEFRVTQGFSPGIPGILGSFDGAVWGIFWSASSTRVFERVRGLSGIAYGNDRFIVVGDGAGLDFPTGVILNRSPPTGDWS
jgi:hypothetical protein